MLAIVALLATRQPIDHLIPGITSSNTTTGNTTDQNKPPTSLPKTNASNMADSNTLQQTTPENSTTQTTTAQTVDAENNESLPPISPKVAAEVQRLEDHSTEGLVTTQRSDGSAYINLQGRMQTTTVAVVDKNGKLIIRHGGDFLPDTDTKKNDEEKK